MVYECKWHSWMTDKECKNCFIKTQSKIYEDLQHCRIVNVISEEDNNDRNND